MENGISFAANVLKNIPTALEGAKMYIRLFQVICAVLIICNLQHVSAGVSPYPSSPVIEGVTWDYSGLQRVAPGSDLWPITWADNGHLYTTWGDGGGFGGTNDDGRVSLGFGRVEGTGESFTGYNVWGGKNPEVPATFEGKVDSAIISIAGTLYIFVQEQDAWKRSKIGKSTNHGQTWVFNGGTFDESGWDFAQSDGFMASPSFIQFGKDYAGARDTYVYGYSNHKGFPDDASNPLVNKNLCLFRVPKTQIMTVASYEYFAGLDGGGNPTWTSNISSRQSVFYDANGVGWNVNAMYHPVAQRYLMTVRHNESGGWGIFDAPEPWGPWTTVAYYENWIDSTFKFTFNFNQKWMSTDGKTMWMVFSGTGVYDSFNVIKGTFTLKPFDKTPPAKPTGLEIGQ